MVVKGHKEIETLIEKYQAQVFRFCIREMQNKAAAEDAVQEVFIRAWKGLDTMRDKVAIPRWLQQIAANVCHDMRRGKIKKLIVQFGEAASEQPEDRIASPEIGPSGWLMYEEFWREFEGAVNKLTPACRNAFIECFCNEMSYKEAAKKYSISVISVRSRVSRAKSQIEKELNKLGYFKLCDVSRSAIKR